MSADHVDFGALYRRKLPLLFAAYEAWKRDRKRALPYGDFDEFRGNTRNGLPDYACSPPLKDHFGGKPWWEWPETSARFPARRRSSLFVAQSARVEAYEFMQYLFFGQWSAFARRAAELGIAIIGDTPIFAALDSADVWANPELFQLDRTALRPTASPACRRIISRRTASSGAIRFTTGPRMPSTDTRGGSRVCGRTSTSGFVRIDHFRGFEAYWSIPADAPTLARVGGNPGPGLEFFEAIRRAMPEAKLIARGSGR